MFNYARTDTKKFNANKVVGGTGFGDYHSYRILYAGKLFTPSKNAHKPSNLIIFDQFLL